MEIFFFHPIPEADTMRHALCLRRCSRAAATLASSFAMTSSAGIQSLAASERAIEARPRRMNADCSTLSQSSRLMRTEGRFVDFMFALWLALKRHVRNAAGADLGVG